MDWYYKTGEEQHGPFSDAQFESMVQDGTINADTPVKNDSMAEWAILSSMDSFRDVKEDTNEDVSQTPGRETPKAACSECGRLFEQDELASFKGALVCAQCKPAFLQKLREGVQTNDVVYAGFWIRTGAKIVDYIILTIINYAIAIPLSAAFMPQIDPETMAADPQAFKAIMIPSILVGLLQLAVNVFYATWFVGKFAATPGKMACRLEVVTAENQRVSYLRAFGRFFADMLSGMLLCIGYIMVGFDSEKRALHDRICATRVVKNQRQVQQA